MAATYASLKISEDLYKDAQKVAEIMHRSVPGQVEYWANLGRALERRGATVQEIQTTLTELRGDLPSAGEIVSEIHKDLASGEFAKGIREVIRKEAKGENTKRR